MKRSTVLCVLCTGVLVVNAEQRDALFSFGGLEALRGPECVPETYRLPTRINDIADQCLQEVEQGFGDLDLLNNELAVLNDPKNQARTRGSSIKRFQLGIRDCMSEKMGYVDDNGEFIKQRLKEEIAALGFPAPFERDVQSASRACLYHTPENLSVERRQDFYYICRDTLLEASCLYKRLERDDPERALDIGIEQTQCLNDIKPTPTVLEAMDKCKSAHNVPVQYASLRRKKRTADHHVDDVASPAPNDAPSEVTEGSGDSDDQQEALVVEEYPEEEEEDDLSVPQRVNLFIHCVYETIGALQPDGKFDATPLIEELKEFEGNGPAVKLQVDAATRCQDRDALEAFNACYYDDVSSGCHIFKVQRAFHAGDPALLPEY